MIKDGRGDMGFMESMLSMMAVVIVIGLYLAFAASSSVGAYSPLDELDPGLLMEGSPEGPVISESYAYMFMFNKGLRGMTVSISSPHFSDTEEVSIGEITGAEYDRRFLLLEGYGNGRTLPTILEVRVFA